MTSSVIPSLKKSWPGSPDRFLKGSTANDGSPARRAGPARVATSTVLGAAPSPNSSPACARVERPSNKSCDDERSGPCRSDKGSASSPSLRLSGGYTQRVSANRLGDILDAMVAKRAVVEIELVFDLLVNGLRDANGARLRERLEPGCDVDAVTENVIAVDDDVAEIDADAQLETALRRDGVVEGARSSLHLDGAVQRIDDAGEIRQQAVARRADDPPVMRRNQRVDGAAELAQRLMGACFILAHQPAETDHIRMQDGGQFPLPRTVFEDFGHRPSKNGPKIGASARSPMRLTPPRATRNHTLPRFARPKRLSGDSAPGEKAMWEFVHRD